MYEPKVGDKLYLRQFTGNYWVDMVKRPYTVCGVQGRTIYVQKCKLIFHGPCYYDTVADEIEADPRGQVVKMRWSEKKQRWQETPADTYPQVAVFGKWEHQPYLN